MNEITIDILKYGVHMFTILNPFGAIPVFLSLTKQLSDDEIKKISTSCALAVFTTIVLSLIIGREILSFFGISLASFRIGGGILIGTIAYGMLHAKQSATKLTADEIQSKMYVKEIGIVPLAIPLLAGPGSISTSILYAETFNKFYHIAGAVILMVLLSFVLRQILRSSRKLGEKIGTIGLNVMTRIMGLILLSLAVEFVVKGLKDVFPGLFT